MIPFHIILINLFNNCLCATHLVALLSPLPFFPSPLLSSSLFTFSPLFISSLFLMCRLNSRPSSVSLYHSIAPYYP